MAVASFRAVMQAPGRFLAAIPESDVFELIWDSKASISITHDPKDFPDGFTKPAMATQLKGIAKGLKIEGEGHVEWLVHDTQGNLRTLRVPAYYVPKIRVRLLSTSSLLQTYQPETITVEGHQLTLSGIQGDSERASVIVRNNLSNNLPMSIAHRPDAKVKATMGLSAVVTEVH